MKLTCLLLLLLPLLTEAQFIKGRVAGDDGTPVTAASIHFKNGRPVVSDEHGNFSISIPANLPDTLFIGAVGFQPLRVSVSDANKFLQLTLRQKNTVLAEVILNTGYQEIAPERATGSFTSIDKKLFNQQVSTDILSRLEGIASSVLMNRTTLSPHMMIRGLSSINGPKHPLVILDNFPYEGDITNINPNDVEHITILKDAAAASIWGSRAGNGVIVITTKKGKLNQPLQIDFTSNITQVQKTDLFYLPDISTSDYIDVEMMLFSNGYSFSDTALSSRPSFSPVYEILFKKRRGLLSDAEATAQIDALRNKDIRQDFDRYMYRNAINWQTAIGLRGGSNKSSWYFSAGYDRNIGEIYQDFRRLTVNLKNSFVVHKNITIHTGVSFITTKSENGRLAYDNRSFHPYESLADENGNAIAFSGSYRQTYIDTAGAGKLFDWRYYPLTNYQHEDLKTQRYDLLTNINVSYNILPGLNIDCKYQFQRQQTETRTLLGKESYYTRIYINRFSQINWATGQVTYRVPIGSIYEMDNQLINAHAGRLQLTYNKKWALHEINALAGSEIRESKNESIGVRHYGYDETLDKFSNVDLANTYQDYVTKGNVFIYAGNDIGKTTYRFVSLFANGAYTYRQKYTASFSGRRDASNLYGLTANDKWNPLWSAGLSWQISRENFYNIKQVPFLKARFTYGYSGNVDPSRSPLSNISYSGVSPFLQSPMAIISTVANPSLKWEKVRMLNWGLDFRAFDDRFTGSLEYYQKKATDLYSNTPVDYTTGIGVNIIKNVASMRGQGVDIDLNAVLINSHCKLSISTFFNFYKDRVIDYYNSNILGSSFVNASGNNNNPYYGRPVYGMYSYYWAGLDPLNGNPRGFINGQASSDYAALTGNNVLITDVRYHGPVFPAFAGAFAPTISYKGLSLSIRFLYKLGYYVQKRTIDYNLLYQVGDGHSDFAKRWQKPGDELFTNVPSMIYPAGSLRDAFYKQSEINVRRGDNMRLQYINASWNWNGAAASKLPFRSLRIFFATSNLGIIWKKSKDITDPDYEVQPPSPQFSFGIQTSL